MIINRRQEIMHVMSESNEQRCTDETWTIILYIYGDRMAHALGKVTLVTCIYR